MSSLLRIASRVEAAVAAYNSVKPAPNLEEWRNHLDQEKIEAARQFRLLRTNEDAPPPLHPTLAALFMVLEAGADLSQIGRSYPRLRKHKYYVRGAKFPDDITDLLPPTGERWWETLAAEARQRVEARVEAPSVPSAPKIRFLFARAQQADDVDDMEVDAGDEELDELAEDDYIPPSDVTTGRSSTSGRAGESSTESRKRKAATLLKPAAVKRHAGASRKQASAPSAEVQFTCERCLKAGLVCETDPLRPCRNCTDKKLRCSLMPINEETGRPVRKKMTAGEMYDFRLRQHKIREGKQPARAHLQTDGASGSGVGAGASPSAIPSYSPADASERAALAGAENPSTSFFVEVPALKKLRRPTAPSSTAPVPTPITPAPVDAPAAPVDAPSAPAPDPAPVGANLSLAAARATPTPSSGPGSSPCHGSPALAPALRRFLIPGVHQVTAPAPTSPSRRLQNADATRSSPDSDLAVRIRALEREFEEWKRRDEEWKREVGEHLRRLGA